MGDRHPSASDLVLYADLSDWWPLLSDPADYEEEAAIYVDALTRTAPGPLRTVLELGSGGGNNASHLKRRFEMTLTDASPGMIRISRALNPECEHVVGDMRTVRLEREFDAVFVHDAIVYMTTAEDLRAAIETARVHLRPGGVALFVPDCTRETFKAHTKTGGHDGGNRSLRYLMWVHRPAGVESTYVTSFAYMLKEGDAPVRVQSEDHVMGLFSRSTWIRVIEEAGLAATVLPYDGSTFDPPVEGDLFLGVRQT